MTTRIDAPTSPALRLCDGVRGVEAVLAAAPAALPLLALRLALAVPFFKSGLTKWDGFFNLSAGARYTKL